MFSYEIFHINNFQIPFGVKKKKSKGPKKTSHHKGLIRLLKAKKLPTGGSVSVLERRVKLYLQSVKKTIKSV